MKKLFGLFLLGVFLNSAVFAVDKNLYVVKNKTPDLVVQDIKRVMNDNSVVDLKSNVIILDSTDSYYIRTYKNNTNSDIYVYSNNESLVNKLNSLGYKLYPLNDKSTLTAYNKDFISYVSDKNLKNFKHKKQDDKKKNEKYKSYTPYNKTLHNKILARHKIQSDGITIIRNKMQPKVRVKDKAMAYEYLITNSTGRDIVINKIASSDFIGQTQIAAYCAVPNFKMCIPVYGIVYGAQTDLEKNRFTRPHPVDEIIKSGDTMRVLALSKKADDAVADFVFKVGDKTIRMTFNPKGAEEL